jgi:hypothetical protein
MRRWMPLVVAALVGLIVSGCGEPSADERARDDAWKKVEAAYGQIAGSPRIWPAEALGRRAIEAGLELLTIDGVEFGKGDPVTMVVRVVGYGQTYRNVIGRGEDRTVEQPYCFRLTFVELHKRPKPEYVECPEVVPITYPPLLPPPVTPSHDAIKAVLAGVAPDVDAIRAALATLDIDARIRVDIAGDNGVVGVGLLALGNYHERLGCTMVLIGAAGTVEIWGLSSIQYQPGELSCNGTEAVRREGITPPH